MSSPGSANSTIYPGPSMTSANAVTASVSKSENAAVAIVITGICRDWFAGQPQHGIGMISAGEDNNAYTSEFWTRENSNSNYRPRLKVELTVRI